MKVYLYIFLVFWGFFFISLRSAFSSWSLFLLNYFIYFYSKFAPLFSPPSQSSVLPNPLASERVLPYPHTCSVSFHSPHHPPSLGINFYRIWSILSLDNVVLCYICSSGHGPPHSFSLVGGLISGNSEGSGIVDTVVIPLGLQHPSAPSIFPLILP